jgi:methylated-DNA-[protein]-cysteine S-methyltransferase
MIQSDSALPAYCLYIESPLGLLEIVANEHAITHVSFCTERRLEERPSAVVEKCGQELREYFSGERTHFETALDPAGTPFERQVWLKLQDIEFGLTSSYGDLSRKLDNHGAIRAVGRANGKNPIAILIPCHRVIGADGSLTGYAGELWRKRWLLDHEARLSGTLLF